MAWLALIVTVVVLIAAISVLALRNYLAAVAATSVVSLGVSILFVILRAPDVALTEAAVGAGLSGVIMALVLRRMGLWSVDARPARNPDSDEHRDRD